MRVALAVNPVTSDFDANLDGVVKLAHEAADAGADLVLFPEAAITGLINDDDPGHDLPLGQSIPGPYTEAMAGVAEQRQIWLAFGLFERDADTLYDSAVLLSPSGEVVLRHRRVNPGWHGRQADPAVYRHGEGFCKVSTPLGSAAFSVCGEYFDDALATSLRGLQPDWLLAPMARCFDDGSYDQERWDWEELPKYRERVRLVGATALLTNYLASPDLDGGSFGGAWAISGDGALLAALPLGQAGILVVNL